MSNDIKLNRSSHCSMCAFETGNRADVRNYVRVRIGSEHSETPRIAVCMKHDLAGPIAALPIAVRMGIE